MAIAATVGLSGSRHPADESVQTVARPEEAEALREAVLSLISEATDPEVQVEASRLMTTIVDLGLTADAGDLMLMRSAIAALKAKSGNIRVSKFVRNRIELEHRNRKSGFVPWISRKLGDSPVYAMLIGVICSAVTWGVGFAIVVGVGGFVHDFTGTKFIMPADLASPLAFAAFVGGLVSLLSRIEEFASLYIFDPFLVFLNSFLKPLIGTVLALTIFAILKSNVVQVSGLTLELAQDGYRYVFWAFGFVAGFSERLAGDFIARAETVVGRPADKGEKNEPAR